MTGEPGAAEGPDPVGLVLGALGFAALLGICLQTLVTIGVDALKAGAPPADRPSLTALHALVLLLGTPAGIALAGYAAWSLLAPIRNAWRQAMLAIMAGLGSFVLSVLVIWPVHAKFGRPGLIGLAVGAGLAAAGIYGRIAAKRRSR